jgi:hypothetical protein
MIPFEESQEPNPPAGDQSDAMQAMSLSNQALSELKYHANREVALGVRQPYNTLLWIIDFLSYGHSVHALHFHADRLLEAAFEEHRRQQLEWPATTDCDLLDAAFKELEAAKILCRQDFGWTDEHGHEEIALEMAGCSTDDLGYRGYVFFSMAAADQVLAGRGLNLQFGTSPNSDSLPEDIGLEVTAALQRQGLKVKWDGNPKTSIQVAMVWRKRWVADSW